MLVAALAWHVVSAQQPAAGQDPDGARDLAQRISGLAARVEQAEALRAIKRLQYAYGHYVEFGLWHDFANLFADDAVAHYPAGDLGREGIRELFLEQVGGGRLGLADGRLYPHFVLQPVVTLDPGGRSARGRWHVLTLLGGLGGNATWVGSLYDNDYVLEDGIWKLAELRTYTQFSGSYAGGWTHPRPPTGAPGAGCENYLLNDCTNPFRYDAAEAGAPVIASAAAARGSEGPADAVSLQRRAADLERRVTRLLDESAVRNLQHAYGYYVDRRRWDDVADLFAGNATLEPGLNGVYRGRESIRRALDQFGADGLGRDELNDHLQLETIVTVAADGASARARGIDFALVGEGADAAYRSEWREAVFENAYVKEDGVWKIAAMHLYPRFATDYALGWAEDARPPPGASDGFPPDAPPSVVHGVYPEFFAPPFHFENPVTGSPAGLVVAPATPGGGVSIASIAEVVTATERRFDQAIAHDAVENIMNAHSFALDEFDRAAAGDLFAVNGSATVTNPDVAGGREQILAAIDWQRDSSGGGRPTGVLAIHQTLQPVIDVAEDGRSARFRFRLFEPAGALGGESVWIAGIYDGEAIVEDGIWKLDRLTLYLTWAADYSAGWSEAAGYSRLAAVPFHYDNPVSGRERPEPVSP